jgi:pyruvate kinase
MAAVRIAKSTSVQAIVTLTYSGYTAFQISSHRPNSHIIVYSSNKRVITMLNLVWGVRAYYYDLQKSTDETIIQVNMLSWNHGYVEPGDFVINLNATPAHEGGKTNTLRLTTI